MGTNQGHHPQPKADLTNHEDVRAAYQSAIQLITYEGQLSWQTTSVFVQFGILLVAASVFPSFIGTDDKRLIAVTGFVLSIIGLIASVMWWSMIARSRRYYTFWIYNASELEKYMSEKVRTFRKGYRFSRNHEVKFTLQSEDGEELVPLQFKFIERIKMTSNFHLLYGTFTAIFLLISLINLFRLGQSFFHP